MAPVDTIIQDINQILSSPAWTGVGVIISSTLSYIALRRSQQPQHHHLKNSLANQWSVDH
jgi:hypothetical protein